MAATLWLLFASGLTSATLLPGSSEAALVAALLALGNDPATTEVVLLLAGVTLGNGLGSMINWGLGRFFSHFRERRWFPVGRNDFARAERWYARWGIWSLALSWVPVIGDPITLVAGVLHARLLPFILIVFTAKAVRYLVLAWGVMLSGA